MMVLTHGFVVLNAERITALAARHKMPVLYGWHDFVVQGGLMSCGDPFNSVPAAGKLVVRDQKRRGHRLIVGRS